MSRARRVTRLCGSCRKTLLSGYNPGLVCGACERALFDRQHLADPDARDDMAAWVWETGPMRDALARLDFPAVLVIYRSAAGLSRRELAERTGLSESVAETATASGPDFCGSTADPASVTMSCLRPAATGGAGHG